MSDTILPERKLPKLIVVMAFDPDDEGIPQTVFGPQDYPTEERAVRTAKGLAAKHKGVIAWSREAEVDVGEYGPPTTLFQQAKCRKWCDRSGHVRPRGDC
ncbi:hypothetical protein [Mesorhizobium sp. CAU 1732]|uniref:hypothetical protein n=1 Tax=Mesorhizobium sp. CAU 1732 TaxID=3140358 RepID=UPI003260F02A